MTRVAQATCCLGCEATRGFGMAYGAIKGRSKKNNY
jgi:hypothetical protein